MLCQFIPFCNILGLIFPGLDFFKGLCFVFVVVGTFILSASTFLFIIGLCWSCTRGYAALVLIIVALLGDVMIFGGLISIIAWVVLAAGVMYLYFGYLPQYYADQKADKPEMLQDLGNWYEVKFSPDDWHKAAEGGYNAAVADSRDLIKSLPYGKESLDVTDKVCSCFDKCFPTPNALFCSWLQLFFSPYPS